jgi:predicted component of type VI protein secretion system
MKTLVGRKFEIIKSDNKPNRGSYDQISDEDYESIQKELGATRLRIWLPGTIGTMDYRPDRHNVYLDANGVVTEVEIG